MLTATAAPLHLRQDEKHANERLLARKRKRLDGWRGRLVSPPPTTTSAEERGPAGAAGDLAWTPLNDGGT